MSDQTASVSILVVDDDELVRETLVGYLRTSGFQVTSAVDGEQALEKLKEGAFDLVLTDLIMPNREGIETIVELRRRHTPVKIIAISGGGRTGDVDFLQMASMLGADGILRKPFSRAELVQKVHEVLGSGEA